MSEHEKEALAWAFFWTYLIAVFIYFVNISFYSIPIKPSIERSK